MSIRNQAIILNAEDKSIVRHEPALGRGAQRIRSEIAQVAGDDHQLRIAAQRSGWCRRRGAEELARPTDPKWKGKILSDDMRAVGGGYVVFFVTNEKLGKTYHEALATQGIQFTREIREAARRVARGEMAIYMPFILGDIQNLRGLPVRAFVPAEGAPYVLYAASMIKDAPHRNAARLYIDFAMSDEVQEIFARDGFGIVRRGVLDKVPAEARAIAEVKLMGGSDPARQNEMLDLARSIYK